MLSMNVGPMDRAFRILFGLLLIAGGFWVGGTSGIVATVVGFIPLFTGIVGRCPAYWLFKFNTCPLNKMSGSCS